jgi:insulysin
MILMKTIECQKSPETNALCNLWVNVAEDLCKKPFTYAASMANLYCSFSPSKHGIKIHLSGFNHKLHTLLKLIIREIQRLSENVTSDLFNRIQDKVLQHYQEFLFSHPYQHATYATDLCLEPSKFHIEDKVSALESISLERFLRFYRTILSEIKLEILVHGNVSQAEGVEIASTLIDGLKPKAPKLLPKQSVVKLESCHSYTLQLPEFNKANSNSALATLFQIGVTDIALNATVAFFHHLVKEPLFNELRTQEQLGYIVFSAVKTNGNDVKSLLFLIQSDLYSPSYLDGRLETFIDRFCHKLVAMPEEEFMTNVNAVTELFLEKNKNLGVESSKYWNEITNQCYNLKHYQRIAEYVNNSMTIENVIEFYDSFIAKGSLKCRKLTIHILSDNHIEEKDPNDEESTKINYDSIHVFHDRKDHYSSIQELKSTEFLPN